MIDQKRAGIQSVERAITILKSFSQERPERGVNELSREFGLHKSTISRLLLTLEQGGLVSRNAETGRFRLGIDLIGLAAQVVAYMDVREVALPFLRQLADTCQETAMLAVLDEGLVVTMEQLVPPLRQVKNIHPVGKRLSPHCTAGGKVLLAFLPTDEWKQILPTELARYTPHTVTDREEFGRELTQVRAQGYAVAQEEMERGLNVVAAPLSDHTGQAIAALSVAGPAYRLQSDLLPQVAALVVDAARRASEQLGYRPR